MIADASVDYASKCAGWAVWIKSDRNLRSSFWSEPFKIPLNDSGVAELLAIANGLHLGITNRLIQSTDLVLIQSDSMFALSLIRYHGLSVSDRKHVNGIAVNMI